MKKARQDSVQNFYPTDLIMAASIAAHKQNLGDYVKPQSLISQKNSDGTISYVPDTRTPNLLLIREFLKESDRISSDCYDRAHEMMNHFKGHAIKTVLIGKVLNDFDSKVNELVSSEQLSDRQINGYVACLPSVYAKSQVRISVDDQIRMADHKPLGNDGSKVSFSGKVLRNIFSMKWNTNVLTIITDTNQVAFFFYSKSDVKVGSIVNGKGTIKRFTAEGQTQLSRVKLDVVAESE